MDKYEEVTFKDYVRTAIAIAVFAGFVIAAAMEVQPLRKSGIVLLLLCALLAVGLPAGAATADRLITVTLHGEELRLDTPPVMDNGRWSLIPWLVGGDGRFYFSDAAGTALWATAPDGEKQLMIGGLVDGLPVVLEGGLVYLVQWGTLFALDREGQVHLKQPLGYKIPQLFPAPGNRLWLRISGPGGGSLGFIPLTQNKGG